MDKKFRITCTKDFQEPLVIYLDDFGVALGILRDYADKGLFQTFLRAIPGLTSLAFIEVWNETDKDWDIFVCDDEGCSHPELAAEYGVEV